MTETETKLADALRPFASLLQPHHASMPDDRPVYGINGAEITAGDLRLANAVLAAHDTARAQPASVAGRLVWTPAMLEAGRAASMEAEAVYDNDRPKGTWERFGLRDNRVRHIVNAVLAAAPQPAKECDR